MAEILPIRRKTLYNQSINTTAKLFIIAELNKKRFVNKSQSFNDYCNRPN